MLRLRDEGIELPAAAVVCFALDRLVLTCESFRFNSAIDPVIPVKLAPRVVDLYLAGADPRNPDASPLYGDPTGLPRQLSSSAVMTRCG